MDWRWLLLSMAGEETPGAVRPGDEGPAAPDADVTPPAQPTITATPINFHEILLTFSVASDDAGVTRRELFREGQLLASLGETALSYTDSQLDAGERYTYYIVDYDAAGNFTASVSVGATTLTGYRIDSGQNIDYTSVRGNTWFADTAIVGASFQGQVTTQLISNTSDPVLYQSVAIEQTQGQGFTYSFPVPNGVWRVELHFAEWAVGTEVGDRTMQVQIEGASVESALDVFAEAGLETALVKNYETTITDGRVDIVFSGVAGSAFISALGVFPTINVPGSITIENVTASGFDAFVPAVEGAQRYRWYLDGVATGYTDLPQTSFAGLEQGVTYDVTAAAVDIYDFETAQSEIVQATILVIPVAPPIDLDDQVDSSTYYVVTPWGQNPELAEEKRVNTFISFRGMANITRFGVVVLEEGEQNDLLDITLYPNWKVRLYTGAVNGTPDYTLDSSTDPAYFDLTDPSSVGVFFGKYTGGIPAAQYTGVMIAVDAASAEFRVREEFLLEHRET